MPHQFNGSDPLNLSKTKLYAFQQKNPNIATSEAPGATASRQAITVLPEVTADDLDKRKISARWPMTTAMELRGSSGC